MMSVLLNDLLNCVNGVIFIVAVSIIWKVPFYIHWDKQRPQSVECMAVADPEIEGNWGPEDQIFSSVHEQCH